MSTAFKQALESAYGFLQDRPGQSDNDPSQFLSSAASQLKDLGRREFDSSAEMPELINQARYSLPDQANSNSGPGTFNDMPGSIRKDYKPSTFKPEAYKPSTFKPDRSEGPGSGNSYSSENPGFFYGTQRETDIHQRAAQLSDQAQEIQSIGLQNLKNWNYQNGNVES